jgi:ribosomal protein S18 acetylase RimI-like enzyme
VPSPLLERIEHYYDQVPRTATRVEVLGPFTLFVKQGSGWPYYARPSIGAQTFRPEDVTLVRERQRALGIPEAFEWVAETTPELLAAVASSGMVVHQLPLMVLDTAAMHPAPALEGITVRVVDETDDLGRIGDVGRLAFGAPGTAIGDVGPSALVARDAESVAFVVDRLRRGLTVTVAAFNADGDPVSSGAHQPLVGVTEVVGVGTLPAFRRRGIGAAVTAILVEDALRRQVSTVFLSAGSEAIVRVYERLGFRRLATACIAEPA